MSAIVVVFDNASAHTYPIRDDKISRNCFWLGYYGDISCNCVSLRSQIIEELTRVPFREFKRSLGIVSEFQVLCGVSYVYLCVS